jgi:uncharacterized NAD(P)/FAD-binding protein YdhS
VPVVAVVGGGASGALTAIELLRHAEAYRTPSRVVLIDRHGRHGVGQAYATADPRHLLNTCAAKMSALADDPGHLLRWARAEGMDVAGSDFLPRGVYGRYLRATLAAAERRVRPSGQVARVTGTAVSVTGPGPGRPLRVHLSGGGVVDADAVVLATGNRAPSAWPRMAAGPRYVADPWAPGALAGIRDGAPILVVGTGLTMVDVATTVTGAHPDAVVYAVSRHGLLPRRHRHPAPPPAQVSLPGGTVRLADLLRAVRVAVGDNDGEWHGVIDALRPHVPRLWARLSPADRRRFLDLAARYWEIHRHRIPPATASRIAGLRAAGRLQVLRGRLVSAMAGRDEVTVRLAGDGATRELHVGWLVNGTGPAPVTGDPFLESLFAAGLARPDPLRLGLDADEAGAVLDTAGRPHDRIFTLGPTLRGVRYETTAIPEIRAQAAALAPRLIAAITAAHLSPGSATGAAEDGVAAESGPAADPMGLEADSLAG